MVDLTTLEHTEPALPPDALMRLGDTRLRHTYFHVRGLAFLPHNDLLVSCAGGGLLRFFSARNGYLLHQVQTDPHAQGRGSSSARGMAISPDGSRIALRGHAITLWDTRTAQEVARFTDIEPYGGESMAFSPDGTLLLVDGKTDVVVLDAVSLKLEHRLKHRIFEVKGMAFSPDATLLVTADGKAMRFWDVAEGHLLAKLKTESFGAEPARLLFTGPETLLVGYASITGDGQAMDLWRVRREGFRIHTEKTLVTEGPVNVQSLALSPRGLVAAADRKGDTHLFEAESLERVYTFEDTFGRNNHIVFSSDGGMLATGGYSEIRLYDVGSRKPAIPPAEGHTGAAFDVSFSADGKRLASTSSDFRVLTWDLETGARLTETSMPGINADERHKSSRALWLGTSYLLVGVELKQTYIIKESGERFEKPLLELKEYVIDSDILPNHGHYTLGLANGVLVEQDYINGPITHLSIPLPDHGISALCCIAKNLLWMAWRREQGDPTDPLSFVRLRDKDTAVRVTPDFGPHIPSGAPPYVQLEVGYRELYYAQREDGRVDLFASPGRGQIAFVHTLGVAHRTLSPMATSNPRYLRPTLAVPAYAKMERMATTTTKGDILLFDDPRNSTAGQLLSTPWHWTHRLAFSRDGTRLAASGSDGTLLIWELGSAD